ncbi:MAG: nitroreductase family protein [Desulfobulbaceae bacterium]|jgi:nitroreductase|nr:nitroreductase family protein [Desulfobulbaceae bacterium]
MQELIARTRTFRRFFEKEKISTTTLHDLIDAARLGGSAANCQPWQYMLVNTPEACAQVFPHLGWAAYLADWPGPVSGERPSAYIFCLLNHQLLIGPEGNALFDLGIASQNILLTAMELRLGGCRIMNFKPALAALFHLPEHLSLRLVIALGKPKETVQSDECLDNSIRYWRDDKGVHHVPKRSLASCLLPCPLS